MSDTSVGTELWSRLMEACKRQGLHPGDHNEPFSYIKPVRDLERQLSAVTAERDALRVDAERWVRVVALWMASTEMSFKQDEDGMWSIAQIEDVEGALFKPLKGDTPDAAIDAARAK